MSGLDTDSEMMRAQQNKDAPETIEAREPAAHTGRTDLDAGSRRDREAANTGEKAGEAQSANETMDDVFNENRAAAGTSAADNRMMEDAATDGSASLVRKDRSLLGE